MRIVAGAYRGRPLVAPKGQSTRPTADPVRQALFDVLEHASWSPGFAGRRVIDLFAGSGALGLEALSRGAAFCLFVERDLNAREAIADNISALGCQSRARVAGGDATRLGDQGEGGPFDLAFLDPPYGGGDGCRALSALAAGRWLGSNAICVVERARGSEVLDPGPYSLLDERLWGAARVAFLRIDGAPA